MRDYTIRQKDDAALWWKKHLNTLLSEGVHRNDIIGYLAFTRDPSNFSLNTGDIRIGELGQWDVFHLLEMYDGSLSVTERAVYVGIDPIEAREEWDNLMHPEKLIDVECDRLFGPIPDNRDDLNAYIQCLEDMLKE